MDTARKLDNSTCWLPEPSLIFRRVKEVVFMNVTVTCCSRSSSVAFPYLGDLTVQNMTSHQTAAINVHDLKPSTTITTTNTAGQSSEMCVWTLKEVEWQLLHSLPRTHDNREDLSLGRERDPVSYQREVQRGTLASGQHEGKRGN